MTTLLNDVGVEISKRQVIRLLTQRLDGFRAEDAAVLHAALVSPPYVTVDDTGARQARDSMLGLMKTCQKLGLSFWYYLGDRLGISNGRHPVGLLAALVAARS